LKSSIEHFFKKFFYLKITSPSFSSLPARVRDGEAAQDRAATQDMPPPPFSFLGEVPKDCIKDQPSVCTLLRPIHERAHQNPTKSNFKQINNTFAISIT